VKLVTLLGIRLKETANVCRFAANPPFAGSINAHGLPCAEKQTFSRQVGIDTLSKHKDPDAPPVRCNRWLYAARRRDDFCMAGIAQKNVRVILRNPA
jgi:hypothetical protein